MSIVIIGYRNHGYGFLHKQKRRVKEDIALMAEMGFRPTQIRGRLRVLNYSPYTIFWWLPPWPTG